MLPGAGGAGEETPAPAAGGWGAAGSKGCRSICKEGSYVPALSNFNVQKVTQDTCENAGFDSGGVERRAKQCVSDKLPGGACTRGPGLRLE